jgi:hypothetical protein
VRVPKYSFVSVKVKAEVSIHISKSDSFKGTIRVKAENIEKNIGLRCDAERPNIQLLNSGVEKFIGQVPFLSLDTSSPDSISLVKFKNFAKRHAQLEFELISDKKLAELIFTPKFVNLGPNEENSVSIRAVNHFENEEKRKAILKYKVRGTRLSQCLVFEMV